MTGVRRERGVVLMIVLFFTLLMFASIATFTKRATVDAILSRNRDAMARSEALARGGVRLAKALLIADAAKLSANPGIGFLTSHVDDWAQMKNAEIDAGDGAVLRVVIEDSGARLNLNSLFRFSESGSLPQRSAHFLVAFFTKMVAELPINVRALYDPRELAQNLTDYVDPDDVRLVGGFEDDYYQSQSPSYHAANRPLMSVDELALVEGFDAVLLDIIRPYVTVYPFAGGGGVNPNTAAPHVLGLIFFNDGVDIRFAQEDDVRRILEVREKEMIVCPGEFDDICTPLSELLPNSESIHPPLSYLSNIFTIRSEARVGNVRRTVEAVIDRSTPAQPLLLSWKVR